MPKRQITIVQDGLAVLPPRPSWLDPRAPWDEYQAEVWTRRRVPAEVVNRGLRLLAKAADLAKAGR